MDKNCDHCTVRQYAAFKELTLKELHRISICKISKKIKKGDVLFEEGKFINGVFCIRDGVCKVSKKCDNGRDQIIHIITKGDLIGERSLLNNEVSNLKAIAISDVEACFIPKNEFIRDLETNPRFTLAILRAMALSLKQADNGIVEMAQKTVRQRLAATLIHLYEKFEENEQGAINVYLSREDIANIIGTATESAIRLLSDFKKKKLIRLEGKKIILLNRKVLQDIADGF